jgi:predicted phage terminase large subunit-like protein
MFLTCNPNPDHFLIKWVDWYLLESGRADPEKVGKIRYYIMKDGQPIFAETQQELIDQYPEFCYVTIPDSEETLLVPPKSFSFVGATIWDNPVLMKSKPEYVAELNSLPAVEKERLLFGNWRIRPQGSNLFQRDWLVKVDKVPMGCIQARAWDKASEEVSEKNRSPDFTACSPMIHKDKDGFYYLTWNVRAEIKDEKSNVIGKFRKRPGERDQLILTQAKLDGSDCHVVFAVDPGGAGKVEFQESSKKIVKEGFICKADPMPNNKGKSKRFEPFASACQNGLVRIVETTFPNKETLEYFYNELEAFTGGESTRTYHDDLADATASAFNYINTARNLTIVRRNQAQTKTISNEFLQEFPTPMR